MGTLDRCRRPWTEGDYALSEKKLDYWTNFMNTGEPGGDWQPCSKENPFVMELNI